jgi:hypothetical protein
MRMIISIKLNNRCKLLLTQIKQMVQKTLQRALAPTRCPSLRSKQRVQLIITGRRSLCSSIRPSCLKTYSQTNLIQWRIPSTTMTWALKRGRATQGQSSQLLYFPRSQVCPRRPMAVWRVDLPHTEFHNTILAMSTSNLSLTSQCLHRAMCNSEGEFPARMILKKLQATLRQEAWQT